MEGQITELQTKLLFMEIHERKYNLVFCGIMEEKEEDIFDRLQPSL